VDAAQYNAKPSERIVFAPVGSARDGYTSAIVRSPAPAKGAVPGRLHASAAGLLSYLRIGEVTLHATRTIMRIQYFYS
jgi:hypothetical protein